MPRTHDSKWSQMLNKVPEVTFYFWLIKVMCTTVGETAADFLNVSLNFGLSGTSIVTGVLLGIALVFQFRAKKYIPGIYWVTVALVSVFGTLVTDNMTDKVGIPLEASTILFGALLALTFGIWYYFEKTLSIHSIFTWRREAFYWLAILFTFALGTAAGDLMAEGLGLGYAVTGIIIAVLIAIFAAGWQLKMNPVLAFWLIYIMTRPLGASIGDFLSQSPTYGGLGLGATITSYIFFGGIIALVLYLTFTKRDEIGEKYTKETVEDERKGGMAQTVIVVAILVALGLIGYHVRQASLHAPVVTTPSSTGTSTTQTSLLGDLSSFRAITQSTYDLLNAGNQAAATKRVDDLEYGWDTAEAMLKPRDPAKWTEIDGKIDTVLRQLRAVNPNSTSEKSALQALLASLQ